MLRAEAKATQEEVGRAIGKSRSLIADYERGYRQPTIDVAVKLAEFFNVSVDFLLGETELPDRTDLGWEIKQLQAIIASATPDSDEADALLKEAVYEYVEDLLNEALKTLPKDVLRRFPAKKIEEMWNAALAAQHPNQKSLIRWWVKKHGLDQEPGAGESGRRRRPRKSGEMSSPPTA